MQIDALTLEAVIKSTYRTMCTQPIKALLLFTGSPVKKPHSQQ